MGYRLRLRRRRGWLARVLAPYNTYTVPHHDEWHAGRARIVVSLAQPWWAPLWR